MMFKAPWKPSFWKINSAKKVHGIIGMLIFSFLLVTALTGMLYRFLRVVVGLEGNSVEWLMTIHAFKYSKITMFVYVHILLVLIVFLSLSGCYSFIRSKYLWIKYKFNQRSQQNYSQMEEEEVYSVNVEDISRVTTQDEEEEEKEAEITV
jgi:cytochrome b subunit of formate dehydrogenase